MTKHPFNFWFTTALMVFIGFNAPWYVTVAAFLAAVEWKVTPEAREAFRKARERNVS